MPQENDTRIGQIILAIESLLKGYIPDPIPHDKADRADDQPLVLIQKMNQLIETIRQAHEFIMPLSRGDLDVQAPKANLLVSPFLDLQASLRHLTWQTRQIAMGDYGQRVEFMGEFSRAFNSMVDSLREARYQLNAEIQRYQELVQIKDNYLRILAHDIRTPTSAIISITEIVQKKTDNAELLDHLEIIKKTGDSILYLIGNILDMARLGRNRITLHKKPFSVQDLVEELIAMIRPLIQDGVEFIVKTDASIPSQLYGDSHRIQQILVNLLGNAAKFTSNGYILFEVNGNHASNNGYQLNFSIKDTGIGIKPENLNRIFSPFTQENKNIASKYGGSGLGLSISRELVALMGGELNVESQKGKGTRFWFSVVLETTQSIDPAPPQDVVPQANANFLIVDENQYHLKTIARYMDLHKARYTLCSDPLQTTSLIQRAIDKGDPFTIVWMDLDMSRSDAVDMALKLRSDPKSRHLKLIACTESQVRAVAQSNSSLFEVVVKKPISDKAIQRVLDQVTKAPETSETLDQLSGLKVLVVDDNALNRFIVKIILEKLGVHVTEAENGLVGFELVMKQSFDVVLIDRYMPVMEGIEALKKIRKVYSKAELPVLGFSASTSQSDLDEFIQAGASGIVTKPVDMEQLAQMLWDVTQPKT